MPGNQIKLTLTFARGELPYIHAKRLPTNGVENIKPVGRNLMRRRGIPD